MKKRVNHNAMPFIGYTTPWSVVVGGTVNLHLSCLSSPESVSIRRLDDASVEPIEWQVESLGNLPIHRDFDQGSYLAIRSHQLEKLDRLTAVRFELFLTRNSGRRTVLDMGRTVLQFADGRLFLVKGDHRYSVDVNIPHKCWIKICLRDRDGLTCIEIQSTDPLSPFHVEETVAGLSWDSVCGDLLFGTEKSLLNPTLNARFSAIELETVSSLYAWQFPTFLPDSPIRSTGDTTALLLELVNLPTSCVTSSRWDGSSLDPRLVPTHYDAVHCHDDDMASLDWPASYRVKVPETAACGIYVFEVQSADQTEQIVFFVASKVPRNQVVFVVPTATYLAYADEILPEHLYEWKCDDRGHRLAVDNNFKSLYDYHSDLSGVSICSYQKPKATLRADYRYPLGDCPHNLPVDLHFLQFCHRHGIEFDLITDHDLHNRGPEGLHGYGVVVTGSHPEYLSIEMENAYRQFAANGGSVAYMGGNGFAGTVAFKDDLMELRRSPLEAGRTWDGPIAEQNFAITNEPGGHLRSRGRGEFSLVGGAISLMGFDGAQPFTRTSDSFDPAHQWLFDGVAVDTFGDSGIVLGGAAGYEVDATDIRLGTSPDTIVVARASGFPDSFFHDSSRWYEGGDSERDGRRCGEMTVRYLSAGGIIFSASSVAWLGALPCGDEMNDVGRITLNVLRHLSSGSGEEKPNNKLDTIERGE
ncbi:MULTISPECIES: N,N-dimethylformamidase beta subunit family domain-containing protein [unclassified Phyllobacterium]|uniref:N,N-dimethylformamidase beta subunit family domain-containing protein n=1 Tax=unclassified Phyllobacterium TaxID=2638441 RepID=UPI003012E7DE